MSTDPWNFRGGQKSHCPTEIVSPLFKPAQEAKYVGMDLVQMPAQCVCIVIEQFQRAIPSSCLNALLNDRQLLNIAGRIQGSMENLDRDSNMAGPFHGGPLGQCLVPILTLLGKGSVSMAGEAMEPRHRPHDDPASQ